MKQIPYEDSLLDVYFNRIFSTSEKYFVELKRDDVPVACFDMKQDKLDRWIVVDRVPTWVRGLAPELTGAIIDHRS